jgi:hypothetical protein
VWPGAGEATVAMVVPKEEESGKWTALPEDERARRNHERRQGGRGRRVAGTWCPTGCATCGCSPSPRGSSGPTDGPNACVKWRPSLRSFGLASAPLPTGTRLSCTRGHGWHVNFFVGRRFKHDEIGTTWGHGFVWVKDWVKDSRIVALGLPLIEAIRFGASYGCKYAAKDWAEEMLAGGAHRYEVAQGFAPIQHTFKVDTLADGLRVAIGFFWSCMPDSLWRSDEAEHWAGPPVWCLTGAPKATWTRSTEAWGVWPAD